ncbi:hypothetical protein JAAARDRAFT_519296 [Jaapia argillacea MUCL 33604]|uniref:Uncharacterized protein n=1 Tax=Jaapia argillacea MUCL 33604 TaxID=933084 RepID=A0A067QDX3_9AGAM|nr:hypothetical protein JAAARDRAFT_519296 [Jaapia argillacea MUCL 33604]
MFSPMKSTSREPGKNKAKQPRRSRKSGISASISSLVSRLHSNHPPQTSYPESKTDEKAPTPSLVAPGEAVRRSVSHANREGRSDQPVAVLEVDTQSLSSAIEQSEESAIDGGPVSGKAMAIIPDYLGKHCSESSIGTLAGRNERTSGEGAEEYSGVEDKSMRSYPSLARLRAASDECKGSDGAGAGPCPMEDIPFPCISPQIPRSVTPDTGEAPSPSKTNPSSPVVAGECSSRLSSLPKDNPFPLLSLPDEIFLDIFEHILYSRRPPAINNGDKPPSPISSIRALCLVGNHRLLALAQHFLYRDIHLPEHPAPKNPPSSTSPTSPPSEPCTLLFFRTILQKPNLGRHVRTLRADLHSVVLLEPSLRILRLVLIQLCALTHLDLNLPTFSTPSEIQVDIFAHCTFGLQSLILREGSSPELDLPLPSLISFLTSQSHLRHLRLPSTRTHEILALAFNPDALPRLESWGRVPIPHLIPGRPLKEVRFDIPATMSESEDGLKELFESLSGSTGPLISLELRGHLPVSAFKTLVKHLPQLEHLLFEVGPGAQFQVRFFLKICIRVEAQSELKAIRMSILPYIRKLPQLHTLELAQPKPSYGDREAFDRNEFDAWRLYRDLRRAGPVLEDVWVNEVVGCYSRWPNLLGSRS